MELGNGDPMAPSEGEGTARGREMSRPEPRYEREDIANSSTSVRKYGIAYGQAIFHREARESALS